MKASPLARLPAVVLIGLCAGVVFAAAPGCADGTTPVCDDAGSCLLSPSGDAGAGGQDAAADVAGDDGPAE